MKFRFKIQQYQTDAVDAVVRVFAGQPYSDAVKYRRDIGEVKPVLPPTQEQTSFLPAVQPDIDDVLLDDTGFLNENLIHAEIGIPGMLVFAAAGAEAPFARLVSHVLFYGLEQFDCDLRLLPI